MNTVTVNKYDNLKRKIYLVVLPILLITNIFYWLFSPNVNRFMEITVPPTCLLLIILWIFIYKNRYFHFIEKVCVLVASIYYLIRVNTMTTEIAQNNLNVYMFWSPIFYIFIFMVLERRKALYYSSVIFSVVAIMSIFIIDNLRIKDIMMQFYISTLTYIIILYYFKKVVSAYIESDMLKKNAYYDYLTNIGNRRSVDTWLENEIQRANKTNSTFSIIFFDIDHFKKVNDQYGHEIGDQLLKEMSTLVSSQLQPSDYFGRWGGEEFIIIGCDRNLTEAAKLAETLRKKFESHPFQHVQHITSSFGVATFEPNDSSKTLIKRADEALYLAKNNGRNKVTTASLHSVAFN